MAWESILIVAGLALLYILPVTLSSWYYYELHHRLPKSQYRTLLLIACASLGASLVLTATKYATTIRDTQAFQTFNAIDHIFFTIHSVIFVLAELEFIQVLSPFFTFLSPTVLMCIKHAAILTSLLIITQGLIPSFLPDCDLFWIFGTFVQVYEAWQQCFLLFFVIRHIHLNTPTTHSLKMRFTALVVFSLVLLVPVMWEKKIQGLLPWKLTSLFGMAEMCFEYCAFHAVIVVQELVSASRIYGHRASNGGVGGGATAVVVGGTATETDPEAARLIHDHNE
eukprot:jgi/Hompol1/6424/HPOL_002153-RA